MAVIGAPLQRKRPAEVRGILNVYVSRGQLVVASWPRKRGSPKTRYQRGLVEFFRQVSLNYQRVSAYEQSVLQSIVTTAKRMYSGQRGSAIIRARDWYQRVAMGRMWAIAFEDGHVAWPESFARDISDALDVLLCTQGSLLVRGVARWDPTRNAGGSGAFTIVAGEPMFPGAAVAGEGDSETSMGGYSD